MAAAVAGLAGLGTYFAVDAYTLNRAKENVRDVLLSHRGVHLYIQRTMHPEFYRARTNQSIALDYYAPEVLSSSFMVRVLHKYYNEEREAAGLPKIYYKMAADNPRNPVNRADEDELRLLTYFRAHPQAKEFSRVEHIQGVRCLVFALPFLRTDDRCLVCHGDPAAAPSGLRARYPGEAGYHEPLGGLRAIESVRVPIEREQLAASVATLASLSGFGVIALLAVFNRVLNQTVRQRTNELAARERTFRRLLDAADAIPFEYSPEQDRYTFVGPQYQAIMGAPPSSLGSYKDFEQVVHPEDRERVLPSCREATRAGKDHDCELRVLAPGGGVRILHQKVNFVREEGRSTQGVGFLHDVTVLRREESIQQARLAIAEDAMTLPLEGLLRRFVDEVEKLTGSEAGFLHWVDEDRRALRPQFWSSRTLAAGIAKGKGDRQPFHPTDLGKAYVRQGAVLVRNNGAAEGNLPDFLGGRGPLRRELLYPISRDGKWVALLGVGNKPSDYDAFDAERVGRLSSIVIETIFRKMAEEEKLKVEGQLAQAQKVEAIGRLAGGVAHDFNNMLQAILGNAALALRELPPESPLRESIEEIRKAAQRSGELTRQLLAFARKQTIAPKVVDLNATVASMLNMLRRLIGENIQLAWTPAADLWALKVDPSQIDQILANLCVNARDAIGGVGKIAIQTGNVTVQEDVGATGGEAVRGDYVFLAVSDTGLGMDRDVLAHLFEPFFTTKAAGKGTGLGLATVYGIVRQNNGFIDVQSQPGQGTTFQVFLPRHVGEAVRVAGVEAEPEFPRGVETLLLVEDESALLRIGQHMLQGLGYQVLAASTPSRALELAKQQAGRIQLLITDVVMPEMNGRELARRLVASHPDLRCLFVSGYTADVIAHQGVLEPGLHFLQKPFAADALARKIREILDG